MDHHGWDERYAASDLVWSAEPNMLLPPIADTLSVGTALDLACGEGRNAIWLARQGWQVTAVDFSQVGIDKGRRIARDDANIEWVVADVTAYQPATTFDLVIVFYLHLAPPALALAMQHAIAAVSPGGTLLCVGHALRNLTDGVGGPPVPEILWTAEPFESMLSQFTPIELGERQRPVEGSNVDAIDLIVHAIRNPFHRSGS